MVLKDQQSTTEQIKMGVDMTLKNLVSAFDRAKVKEVKAEKAKFDPQRASGDDPDRDRPPTCTGHRAASLPEGLR